MEKLKELIEKQGRAFEEFKKTNDDRLEAIEKKGGADPLMEDKLKKLNDQLSALSDEIKAVQKKANRPGAGAEGGDENAAAEHKVAFYDGFIRKGHEDGLAELEAKAVNVGTPGDGGYAVPIQQDRQNP